MRIAAPILTVSSVVLADEELLDRHAGPLPADQNGRGSTCSRAKSLLLATPEPKLENHQSGACRRAGLYWHFVAQSIEITWIAAINPGVSRQKLGQA